MSEIESVPLPILITIAVTCALLAAFGALLLSALSRITHTQVEEAEDEGQSGPFVSLIVTHRLAAITAVTAVRSGILVLLGATLMVLVGLVFRNLMLNLVGVVMAMLLTLGLTNIIIPPTLGFKYPVRSVRLGGRLLWWLTKIGSIFVSRRDSDDDAGIPTTISAPTWLSAYPNPKHWKMKNVRSCVPCSNCLKRWFVK